MRRRKITKKEQDEFKKKRLEEKSKLTLAYQLGYYVGEQIVHKYLPTLSVDMLHTNNNISVSCAEGDECRRLDNLWTNIAFKSKHGAGDSDEWKALRAYHEMLEEKYLPKTLKCPFQMLNVSEQDMSEFKEGIGASLWDCDCSHYSTKSEDIDVKEGDEIFINITTITLKRSE